MPVSRFPLCWAGDVEGGGRTSRSDFIRSRPSRC